MRHSWKQHAAAAAVTVSVSAVCTYLILNQRYHRGRDSYLARDAHAYEVNSAGNIVGVLIVAIGFTGAILLPYELTLRVLNNKRLDGED